MGSEPTPTYGTGGTDLNVGQLDRNNHAELAFRSDDAAGGTLRLNVRGFHAPGGTPQFVGVTVNGAPVAELTLELDEFRDHDIVLPRNLPAGDVVLGFDILRPMSPLETGESSDTRKLGMALRWFELVRSATP